MRNFSCKSTVTLDGAGIGFDVDVYITYDYAPEEKQTFTSPQVDESYEVTDVKLDINGHLVTLDRGQYDDEQIIYLIEDAAAESDDFEEDA